MFLVCIARMSLLIPKFESCTHKFVPLHQKKLILLLPLKSILSLLFFIFFVTFRSCLSPLAPQFVPLSSFFLSFVPSSTSLLHFLHVSRCGRSRLGFVDGCFLWLLSSSSPFFLFCGVCFFLASCVGCPMRWMRWMS
jgi:hypothetical protein